MTRRLRIALPCPGLGRTRRGYERFTDELARALAPHAEARVFAGRLPPGLRGASLPCAPRGFLEQLGLNPAAAYRYEQLTFAAALAPALAAFRPDVVHFSDPAVTNAYLRIRKVLPGHPPFVFCNGGNISPEHWRRYHHVQLVAPWQVEDARARGIDDRQYSFVPLGAFTARFKRRAPADTLRARLGLPEGLLALSVASLDASIKRLDYVIRELARPGAEPWKLVCLGQRTGETGALQALAESNAPGRVLFRTAMPAEVADYLGAADLFVLASASEGFGLAALEAMAAGLPLAVRDLPSLVYLVGDAAQTHPLHEDGALARALAASVDAVPRRALAQRNEARAAAFDWESLVPSYLALYERAIDLARTRA